MPTLFVVIQKSVFQLIKLQGKWGWGFWVATHEYLPLSILPVSDSVVICKAHVNTLEAPLEVDSCRSVLVQLSVGSDSTVNGEGTSEYSEASLLPGG